GGDKSGDGSSIGSGRLACAGTGLFIVGLFLLGVLLFLVALLFLPIVIVVVFLLCGSERVRRGFRFERETIFLGLFGDLRIGGDNGSRARSCCFCHGRA